MNQSTSIIELGIWVGILNTSDLQWHLSEKWRGALILESKSVGKSFSNMWEDGNGYSADYDFNFLFVTSVGILQKVNFEEICALLLLFFFSWWAGSVVLLSFLPRKEPPVRNYASCLNLSRMSYSFKKKNPVFFFYLVAWSISGTCYLLCFLDYLQSLLLYKILLLSLQPCVS